MAFQKLCRPSNLFLPPGFVARPSACTGQVEVLIFQEGRADARRQTNRHYLEGFGREHLRGVALGFQRFVPARKLWFSTCANNRGAKAAARYCMAPQQKYSLQLPRGTSGCLAKLEEPQLEVVRAICRRR